MKDHLARSPPLALEPAFTVQCGYATAVDTRRELASRRRFRFAHESNFMMVQDRRKSPSICGDHVAAQHRQREE
jgi:hypothetical protein